MSGRIADRLKSLRQEFRAEASKNLKSPWFSFYLPDKRGDALTLNEAADSIDTVRRLLNTGDTVTAIHHLQSIQKVCDITVQGWKVQTGGPRFTSIFRRHVAKQQTKRYERLSTQVARILKTMTQG